MEEAGQGPPRDRMTGVPKQSRAIVAKHDIRQPRKIRYTSAEWSIIVERARQCGRPAARYVRETSLGAVPKPRKSLGSDDLVHELGRIGTTLARLAAQDGGGEQQPAFETVLTELLATVRRLG